MGTKTYKITLRPHSSFYFGNERTLGADNANYFVSSNYFPQQTTLLGMLRYRLLEMKGWLRDSYGKSKASAKEMEDLIGARSFNAQTPNSDQDFGAIDAIFPVFLEQDSDYLLPGALNRNYQLKNTEKESTERWSGLHFETRKYIPILDGFDYKKPIEEHFISASSPDETRSYKEIFQDYDQVGITKMQDGEPDNKAFYKQTRVSFKNTTTRFVFFARIREEEGQDLENFVKKYPEIVMGGERSMFSMTVQETEPDLNIFKTYLKNSDQNTSQAQIILLSDAFALPAIYNQTCFAVTNTRDFRHIVTGNQTTNHSDLGKGTASGKPYKSDGFQLLEKGSVLYPSIKNDAGNFSAVEALSDQAKAFRKIGYNTFLLIENGSCSLYINDQNISIS